MTHGTPPVPTWQTLEMSDPGELEDTRLQLHWAAQMVAWVGNTHIVAEVDDSHTNLGWVPERLSLAGHVVPGVHGIRAALRLAPAALLLLDEGDRILAEQALEGRTMAALAQWMEGAMDQATNGALRGALRRRDYEMQPHAVCSGAPFRPDTTACEELARWYGNADAALQRQAARWPHTSPVRCWPHHFDIATLVTFDQGVDSEEARSMGAGMTPGDGSYGEPYWYVTPWPRPAASDLPDLPAGRWHTENWMGAVLVASEVLERRRPAEQRETVDAFLGAAAAAAAELLGVRA